MKAMQRTTLILALAGVLAIPTTTLLASDLPTQDEHAAHHHDTAQSPTSADPMQAMHDRMRQIQQTTDPEKRQQLMEAQMKDMQAMMQDPNHSCPMMEGKDGMDMAGDKCGKADMGGKGMMGKKCDKGRMGHGMQGGMNMSGQDDMMAKRMEALEKRMDMMQMMMMMQMRMSTGMQGGMGPGMQGGMGMPSK